ncbi:glycosyl hydrolase family 28-related protein [Novipirellula artificiosorum]|uniref:glycosyl hydrolase family 28-related protein n=1 Tax=Novipirellula artificiosorum TaxID=2528016 RepID=UPI0018CD6F28|nr:glycosyl hydrolase family 28-related protein [Novipirellula artificiosorum]
MKTVSVNECGATGDGVTDDTDAIQDACRSGKPVVFFQPGTYLINGTIEVPPTVERLNFMYVDLLAGPRLQDEDGLGAFRVVGESDRPLLIEDLFSFELFFGAHYLVDHVSRARLC